MDFIPISALIGVLVLLLLSVFQIALIAGAPIARFAWGGAHNVLPLKLKMASAISIVLYLVFAVFILSKSNLLSIINNPILVDVGMWIITAYFILGIGMNAISRSKPERIVMTPVALLLAVSFLLIAIS